jgi:hypothetical protein
MTHICRNMGRIIKKKKGNPIPVTGCGGPWGCDAEASTFSRQPIHRWW